MDFETIKFEQDNHIGTLTINRPQALNALNEQVFKELNIFINDIKKNKDIRVLIITGSGEKAFVAGADIKAMQEMNAKQAEDFSIGAQAIFSAIESLPFAVIAAVNGFALGGGCELALSCDIIIAAEKAKFGLPEVTLGLLPSFGGTQRLPRAIGLHKAREMVFTGEFYSAQTCKEIGFVNRVVENEKLMEDAKKLAKTIASKGPIAIEKAKHSLISGYEMHIDKGLKQEAELFGYLFTTQDHNEGISAFLEKRNPDFKGD